MLRPWLVLALASMLGACAPSASGGEAKRAPRNACSGEPLPPVAVRRLSRVEYNRTIRDLLPGLEVPEQALVVDLPVHGFENAASSLHPSAMLLQQYSDSANSVGAFVSNNIGALYPCGARTRDLACGRQFVDDFGARAFRRPLTSEERARYQAFFEKSFAASFRVAVELTTQAFLQAPQFLYRIETGSGPLDDYQVATRLSYFLWQSMPDAQLFAAAAAGQLRTKREVAEQARRMLADPRATRTVVDFHRQWLSLDRIMGENKDASLYPGWNDTLRDAMREEADRFVASIYERRGSMLRDLLTSRTTFVNEPLAAFYGVPVSGPDWHEAQLPPDERSGILTRGDFLAGFAHSTNGSPPLRGVAVLDKLLCARPPPPPANADTSTPKNEGPAPRTNRELFTERTAPKTCQGCHAEIDGIGFSFEHYDAMGAFRTKDNGIDVDATGRLLNTDDVDGPVTSAIELSDKLAGSEQVHDCMVLNWFRFAFARDAERADRCALEEYRAALEQSHGDIHGLLVAIASSDLFLARAGQAR